MSIWGPIGQSSVNIRSFGVFGTPWNEIAAGATPKDEGARIQRAIDVTTATGQTLEFESVCYGSAQSLIIPYVAGTTTFTMGPYTRWLGKPGTMIRALPGVNLEYFIAPYRWVNNIAGSNGPMWMMNMAFDGSPSGSGPYDVANDVVTKRVWVNGCSGTSNFENIFVQNSLQDNIVFPSVCLDGVTSSSGGSNSNFINITSRQAVETNLLNNGAIDWRLTGGYFYRARHPVVLNATTGVQFTQSHVFSGAPYIEAADVYESYIVMDSNCNFHGNIWEGNEGTAPVRYYVKGTPARVNNEVWMADGDVEVEFRDPKGLFQMIGCRGAMAGQIANLSTSSDSFVVDVGSTYFRADPYKTSSGSYRAVGVTTMAGSDVQVLDGIQNTPNVSYMNIGGRQLVSVFPYTVPDDIGISDFIITGGVSGTVEFILPANAPRSRQLTIKREDASAGIVTVRDASSSYVSQLTVSGQIERVIQTFGGSWELMEHTDDFAFPRRVGRSTIAGLPSAAVYEDCIASVSNPAVGKGKVVYSDGAIWRYVSDDTAV